jgi:hypothetical protein
MPQDGLTPDGEVPSSKPVDPDTVPEATTAGRGILGFIASFVIAIVAIWLWNILPEWRIAVVITAVVLVGVSILLSERNRRSARPRPSSSM